MADMFLSPDELATLTGRKVKTKQIEALHKMKVAFFVNACGRAVVARTAVEGYVGVSPLARRGESGWQPTVLEAR